MKRWCLGFIFNETFDQVLLLRKGRTLHVGLWNGIGGNLEPDETMRTAMERESHEETGLHVHTPFWTEVGSIQGPKDDNDKPSWLVGVFATWIYPRNDSFATVLGRPEPDVTSDTPFWVGLGDVHEWDHRGRLAPHASILIREAARRLWDEKQGNPPRPVLVIQETNPF